MQRFALVFSVFTALSLMILPSAPAFAITAKQKMQTCQFGADHPKLAGKQRAEFMKKCMSGKNDPRGSSSSGATAPPGVPGAQGKPN